MGAATSRPEKVVGFHFFYPASMMRLIEVISGELTSEATMQSAGNFAQAIRKQPITCAEVPGFVPPERDISQVLGQVFSGQTATISARMTPYSTEVAASSDSRNLWMAFIALVSLLSSGVSSAPCTRHVIAASLRRRRGLSNRFVRDLAD
jgi:hypothetical protein